MKKRNVLSWLAILSITISTLSGCNSGGGDGGSDSNPGSGGNNGSITAPGNPENPVNPVVPESPEEPVTLKSIEVTADTFTPRAAKGENLKLFATAVYSNGTHKTVTEEATWINETPNILSVSETGEVSTRPDTDTGTGSDVGTGIVIAQFEGIESEPFKIEITQPELTGVVVDPRTKSVAAGFNIQLTAWGLYTDGVPRDITKLVTWHTSKEEVLTFGEHGLANGHETGVAEIQAGFGGYYSPPVPVEVTEAKLQNITITPNKFTLPLGTEQKLVVTGHFSDGSVADITKDVTWKDRNTNGVVDIQNGVFVATHQEDTTLIAEHGDKLQAEVTIEVTEAVVGQIEVSPAKATIAKGTNQEFKATAVYTNGETKDVTNQVKWESGDYRLLTLKDNVASGQNTGKTTVSASLGDVKSAFIPVSVTAAKLTGLTISPSQAKLEKYNVKRFHAVGHYSDGSRSDITELVSWSSNKNDTVALMKDGISNGLELGDATITATKDGVHATASVEVVENDDVLKSIPMCGSLDDDNKENAAGVCLKVASDKKGMWFTSPPSINLMNSLGYKWVHALSPEAQMPKTYNYVRVETGSHGPAGEFAMFNNYGLERQGNTGQWGYWCNELNEKKFAGRTNWRRATMNEMFSLYSKVGGSLWNGENRGTIVGKGLGWPTSFDYWTMTSGHQDYVPYEGYYDLVNMKNATAWMVGHLSDPAYASCVSDSPTSTGK